MLSEVGELSAMRLQMFAWTIAMIVFFIWRVFTTATLWNIPSTLLVLIGFGHGGYLLDIQVRKGAQLASPRQG